MSFKSTLLSSLSFAAFLAGAAPAFAAGNWATLPIVGEAAFCGATVSGVTLPSAQGPYGIVPGSTQGTGNSICAQTVPAGMVVIGDEMLIPADTNNLNGAPPATVTVPFAIVGSLNTHKNQIIGGDFATNLWQRTTTPLTGASPTTYQMSADRFFAISAGDVMTISKQTPAISGADYLGNSGLNSWMRVARPSGTPAGSMCVGQILDQAASAPLIGKNAVLSFYGYAPTTFSASNQQITASIAYYTAADSAVAGTNTATFALSASGQNGGIAGYTPSVAGFSASSPQGTVASGVATVGLTTTPTRYGVYAAIPTTNASGVAVNGVGISICATPTATTTVATDYFELEGVQLQAMPSGASTNMASGVTGYTGFEFRKPAEEATLQYAYSYVFNDGGTAAHGVFGSGWSPTAAFAQFTVPFPAPLRETPVATVSTPASFATYGWTGSAVTATACATLASLAVSLQNTTQATLTCTVTGTPLVAADGAQLVSQHTGATNYVAYSAEP